MKKFSLLKIVVEILLFIFVFLEIILFAPFMWIKINIIINTIERMSPTLTVTSLIALKLSEGAFKFLVPYLIMKDQYQMVTIIMVLDGIFGFLAFNILLYGRESLKHYAFFRNLFDKFSRLREKIYQHKFFSKYKEIRGKMALLRDKIFGEKRQFIAKIKVATRRLVKKYYKKKEDQI